VTDEERAWQRAASRASRLRVGPVLALSIGLLLILAVIGIGLALSANARLTERRELLVDEIAPAQLAALDLENALVNEESGVRGYLLTRQQEFLDPYREGRRAEVLSYRELERIADGRVISYTSDVVAVRSGARAWRRAFVDPVLRAPPRRGAATVELSAIGKPTPRWSCASGSPRSASRSPPATAPRRARSSTARPACCGSRSCWPARSSCSGCSAPGSFCGGS